MNKYNEQLKEAEIYFEDGIPYMRLVYTFEKDDGCYESIYPKVEFPFSIAKMPYAKSYGWNSPHMYIDVDLNYLDLIMTDVEITPIGKTDPETFKNVAYIEVCKESKVKEMTLEQIEKKLGYPVKIISKEK